MKNTDLKRFIQNTQCYNRKTPLNIKLVWTLNKKVMQQM